MKKTENWMTQTDFSKKMNITISYVGNMITRGRINSKKEWGKTLVDANSVTKGVVGRPKSAKIQES